MTFGIAEFREFATAFYQHPEWREELRRLVLTDEILGLPAVVRELAKEQAELAKAQRDLAEAQRDLAEAQRRLGTAFGELQNAFGSTVEEEAASVIEVILRRKGYRILQSSYALPLDSEGEVDVVTPAEDPAGQPVWAVVEAKARLSRRDVLAWAQRMRSPDWRRRLAERGCPGPYLAYVYAIRFDLGAREAAEAEGIGLLKSDGEVLAPRGLIQPADV